MVFKLWSDLDTFLLYLYSYYLHPEDGHVSCRSMLVSTVQ